jgi:hypothetical protein
MFSVRLKSIRPENTVMDKDKGSAGVLCKIADCARVGFPSVRNRRSARTVFSSAQYRNPATTGARMALPRMAAPTGLALI